MSPPVAAARSGPALPAQAALVRAFPVAAVQLSAFPVCKWLQQLCLELHTECLAVTVARKATGAGTKSHRQELLAVLRDLITPDLLPQLHLHWLLGDGIWATHRESSDCFMELELVIQGFSQIFSAGLSLDSCITTVAQHYKECVSKIPPDGLTFSAPHPDHCAAQAAPQSLPTSDLPLAPLVCQGKTSQSAGQASPTVAAAQQKQQPVSASLAAVESRDYSPESTSSPAAP
ncbi:zinc finger SWIM domain-containing protein 1 [Aphelocoma coerulescens]|uniref:zinc finger SWIM domain-containing protein 1 n=1 Tax=Aphelocoma coerulescens TaxID=39617 RepID=UPI0036048559